MKKESCIVKKPHSFLGIKWIDEYEAHDWEYDGLKHRHCSRCKQREIYFGIVNLPSGTTIEDWRKTK